jgi:HrpA-like RNA helicase
MARAAREALDTHLQQRQQRLASDDAYAALQQQRLQLPAAASREELQRLLKQHQVCVCVYVRARV